MSHYATPYLLVSNSYEEWRQTIVDAVGGDETRVEISDGGRGLWIPGAEYVAGALDDVDGTLMILGYFRDAQGYTFVLDEHLS